MSTGIVVALGIDRFRSTATQVTRVRGAGPSRSVLLCRSVEHFAHRPKPPAMRGFEVARQLRPPNADRRREFREEEDAALGWLSPVSVAVWYSKPYGYAHCSALARVDRHRI